MYGKTPGFVAKPSHAVVRPAQARDNAIAAAENLRRQLEAAEETTADKWRAQQREMGDRLNDAERLAAAMKTEYGNAVRFPDGSKAVEVASVRPGLKRRAGVRSCAGDRERASASRSCHGFVLWYSPTGSCVCCAGWWCTVARPRWGGGENPELRNGVINSS